MSFRKFSMVVLIFIFMVAACNLPSPAPDAQATVLAATVNAVLTRPVTQTPLPNPAVTDTPFPTETSTPIPTPTPRNPMVVKDSLCWVGPGAQYEVVSAIKNGTRVDLLGRGSVSGWWIVRNPIYKDPCWILEANLQIDSSFDTSGMKVFYPPPTPTFTPSITPSPTA